MTRVKICGITSKTEVEFINRYLPDYIGFVFAASKRRITPEKAAELAAGLSPAVKKVGVFVDMGPEEAARTAALAGLDALQLCGSEDARYITELRRLLKPGTEVWKAVKMGGSLEHMDERLEEYSADRLILDTYNAKQAGGTGRSFDWGLAQQLGKHIRLPIILAGGLNPGNVWQAIEQVAPFAVDTSSGVEGVGMKDEAKVRSFIEAVRGESR